MPDHTPTAPVWSEELRHWLVRTTENFTVVVAPLIFNDRVNLYGNRNGEPDFYDLRGAWCYAKGGRAMVFALIFNPETDAAPTGWFRDVNAEGYDHTQPGAPEPFVPYSQRESR